MAGENELWRLSASTVVEMLKHKQVTPLELVDVVESRILATDHIINAIPIRCFDRARKKAQELMDAPEPEGGYPAGYLYGLPVAIKDSNPVKGLRFPWSCTAYKDRIATVDDPVVQMLEANGAVVIGKSTMPELYCATDDNSYTGSRLFGTTRNAWDTRLAVGGSSGGSAAALAAGQVWLANGGDLFGSIRGPAAFCGLVGLRPSNGVVPTLYFGDGSDLKANVMVSVAGPMGRTVADVALMLDAMAGQHPMDPRSIPAPEVPYSVAIQPEKFEPPQKLAWSADLNGAVPVDAEIAKICRGAAEWFLTLEGASLEDACPDVADAKDIFDVRRRAINAKAAAVLEEPLRSLCHPEVIRDVEIAAAQTPEQVVAIVPVHDAHAERVREFFREYELLLTPTCSMAAFPTRTGWPKEQNGVKFSHYSHFMGHMWSLCMAPEIPSISIPCGLTADGRPVGLQIVGRPYGDAAILAAAAAFERAHPFAAMVPRELNIKHEVVEE